MESGGHQGLKEGQDGKEVGASEKAAQGIPEAACYLSSLLAAKCSSCRDGLCRL